MGNEEVVQLLLDYGVDVNVIIPAQMPKSEEDQQEPITFELNALQICLQASDAYASKDVANKFERIALSLIQRGIRLDVEEPFGRSLVFLALSKGYYQVVEALLQKQSPLLFHSQVRYVYL
jgi:hypothetical protein